MSPVEVNTKSIVLAVLAGVLVLYMVYAYFPNRSKPAQLKLHDTWKTASFVDIPADVIEKAKEVKIDERHSQFAVDGQDHHVFYRESIPATRISQVPVLLLHGANSNSDTWIKSRTLHMVSAFGYRVVALDLPGWGQSEKSRVDKDKRALFIERFIEAKHLDRPVIVSPSMSGSYAIPFIMGDRPTECTSRVRGYVPIAPVDSHLYEPAQYHRCEVWEITKGFIYRTGRPVYSGPDARHMVLTFCVPRHSSSD